MTPERLEEIRRFHEEEVEIANESEGFPGELTEEVHMIQDLLAEVDRLRAQNQETGHDHDTRYPRHCDPPT